jgi:hypothetical protein
MVELRKWYHVVSVVINRLQALDSVAGVVAVSTSSSILNYSMAAYASIHDSYGYAFFQFVINVIFF